MRLTRVEWDDIAGLNPELTPEVRQAVRVLHAGARAEARRLLARAVRRDPHNATAWFWLGRCVDDASQRGECLRRVRALDRIRADPTHRVPAKEGTGVAPSGAAHRTVHPNRAQVRAGLQRRRLALAGALAVALILTCALVPHLYSSAAQGRGESDEPLSASGVIQSRDVSVACPYGGRIAAVLVTEGEEVTSGQKLVQLDTDLLDAQILVAQAGVALAEASLAQALAGARPGQIAVAEAQWAQAQEGYLAAMQMVTDTAILLHNPQDIQLQIAVQEAQLQESEHQLASALALKDAAEIGKDQFEAAMERVNELGGPGERRVRVKIAEGSMDQIRAALPPELWPLLPDPPADGVYPLGDFELHVSGGTFTLYQWVAVNVDVPFQAHLAPNLWWQAWVGVNAAAAEKEGLQASLNQLYARKAYPQDLEDQADQAGAALAQARAQVAAAGAQVDGLRAGATQEQIAILQARVDQARVALDSLLSQRERMQVVSPTDGVAVEVIVHPGEVAAPGTALLTVAELSEVRLNIYLPERQIGRVSLGQTVYVTVDSFPSRVFEGQVAHIADRAEFTPRNVSTQEERANLVFAIQVRLSNEDRALKPGMPADAQWKE